MAKKNAQDKQTSSNTSSMSENPINQLQAIKEIIVGPEIASIISRLDSLQAQLDQNKIDSEEKMNSLNGEILEKMGELSKKLSQTIEENQQNLTQRLDNHDVNKVNRKDLGEMFLNLGKMLIDEK